MIDYDSFSHCHLMDIFFAFHVGAKELIVLKLYRPSLCLILQQLILTSKSDMYTANLQVLKEIRLKEMYISLKIISKDRKL